MSAPVFITAFCLEKWNKRVNCANCCSIRFVDNEETKIAGRVLVADMQKTCPMRDLLHRKPQFGDPVKLKEAELKNAGS